MADFDAALKKVIQNEGGYVLHNISGDPGGMTYAGISRRYHPSWPGWAIIDRDGTAPPPRTMVSDFYRQQFWRRICGDLIPCNAVAESIFDYAVNVDVPRAVKSAQAVVGAKIDGVFGPRTLAAVKEADPGRFLDAYAVRKMQFYASICTKHPARRKFLLGWINRILNFGHFKVSCDDAVQQFQLIFTQIILGNFYIPFQELIPGIVCNAYIQSAGIGTLIDQFRRRMPVRRPVHVQRK